MVNRVNNSHFNHEESRKCRIERGNRKKSPNMLSLVWKYFGWTYNRHNRFNGNNLLLLSNISIFAIVLFTVPLVLLVLPLCRPFFRSEKLNTQHRHELQSSPTTVSLELYCCCWLASFPHDFLIREIMQDESLIWRWERREHTAPARAKSKLNCKNQNMIRILFPMIWE